MTVQFPCEVVSWRRMYAFCRTLSHAILDSGYRPGIVVAVARGGFVPARIVCDFLGVSELASIRVAHYEPGAQPIRKARLASRLNADIRGKKVLLIDDLVDTGETLNVARQYLESLQPDELRVAVMQQKTTSAARPDFSARTIRKWRWVIYPWAIMEDVGAFLERMDDPPASPADAARRLALEYSLELPASLLAEIFRLRPRK